MGSETVRPMLLMPLLYNHETLGVLFLSKGMAWSDSHDRAARDVADQLASTLGIAHKNETLGRRGDELSASLRDHEARSTQARLALEAQLAQDKADLQRLTAQLEAARDQATHQQKRAEELAALVDLQESHAAQAHEAPPPAGWQDQAQRLEAERLQALTAAQEWQEEVERLLALQATLENELQNAKKQIASLQDLEPHKRVSAPTSEDGSTQGLLVGDARGQIVAASNTAARLLGRNRGTLIGQPLAQVCPDPRWTENIQALVTLPKSSQPVPSPLQFTAEFAGHTLNVELSTLATEGNPASGQGSPSGGGVIAVLTMPADQTMRWRTATKSWLA